MWFIAALVVLYQNILANVGEFSMPDLGVGRLVCTLGIGALASRHLSSIRHWAQMIKPAILVLLWANLTKLPACNDINNITMPVGL